MIATSTTRLFITRTARLRAAWRRADPYTAGSLLIIALIIVGGLVRNVLVAPAPADIIIFATSTPAVAIGGAQHGVVRQLERAPASARQAPTAVPTAVPVPTPEPPAADQQISVESVPQAAPVAAPAQQPPATGWHADPQIITTENGTHADIAVPATVIRYCTDFGDWRDYDVMYASSPACGGQP